MQTDPVYLFTYGTLMQTFENPYAARLRAHANYLGAGHFAGRLYRVTWYPGAIYDPDEKSKVFGEIYRISYPEILDELDEYEDVLDDESASLYLRKKIPVAMESGEILSCWTYLYNQSLTGLTPIPDGRFRP